jgi:hypothetical protein
MGDERPGNHFTRERQAGWKLTSYGPSQKETLFIVIKHIHGNRNGLEDRTNGAAQATKKHIKIDCGGESTTHVTDHGLIVVRFPTKVDFKAALEERR